jgi:hypothetical protein
LASFVAATASSDSGQIGGTTIATTRSERRFSHESISVGARYSRQEKSMTEPAETRSFSVHARHLDAHQARVVHEPTFEAAAVAYVEELHLPVSDGDEVSLIVRDLETGHEHCFKVDLANGETAPCG